LKVVEKKETLLLIEDSEDFRKVLRLKLEKHGYIVHEAICGNEGIGKTRGMLPDCILLDRELPDMLGDEVIKILKGDPDLKYVPILMLTADDHEEVQLEALEAGADDFLGKRQSTPVLLARLKVLLRIRHLMEEIREREREKLAEEQERVRKQQEEFSALDQMARPAATQITAQSFGNVPIDEAYPKDYKEIVQEYTSLLDQAIERIAYKVDHPVSDLTRTIAENLGHLRASPKDVVKVHTMALREKCEGVKHEKAQAYVEEGRLIVLELMGYLASYYRIQAS